MNKITTRRTALRRLTPTPPPHTPPVEEMRTRAVGEIVRSSALAAVIAGHAYSVPERRI